MEPAEKDDPSAATPFAKAVIIAASSLNDQPLDCVRSLRANINAPIRHQHQYVEEQQPKEHGQGLMWLVQARSSERTPMTVKNHGCMCWKTIGTS